MSFRRFKTTLLQKAALLLLVSYTSVPLNTQAAAQESVEGLWGAETRVGLPVSGELTVDGRDNKWRASVAGYEVPASLAEHWLTFTLPGHLGSFKGHFDASHNLQGEWIQPGGVILDPQYATPIALHLTSDSVWRGDIVPLEQRLSAYLLISSTNGKLTAVASNPEGNFFRRHVYTVTQGGGSILLEANGKKFSGTYDPQAGTLSVELVDWLPPLHFTRRTRDDAVGFYPRVPSQRREWVYSRPVDINDGWSVSTLKHEDMDEAPIAKLMEHILGADPVSSPLSIQSLLIARHGHLVLEEYFYGFSQDRVHDMRSSGKTFAPVLVGVARQQGAQLGPETRVYPLFSSDAPFANPDDRKKSMTLRDIMTKSMTLRDIMTMTAGNACDDNDDGSPGNEDRMQSDVQQPDWYKYTLDLPMKKDAGW